MHRESLGGKEGIDVHSRGILSEKNIERCHHLFLKFLWREIWIDQIAEIKNLRISPISSESLHHQREFLIVGGENRCGYIQVLDIIDFIPLFSIKSFSVQSGFVQDGNNPQDLLIVLVYT